MKNPKQIEEFVRDAFKIYLLDYKEFFQAEDFDTGEVFEVPLTFKEELEPSLLKRAATILGVSVDALMEEDRDAIWKWYHKYDYFDLREAFDRVEAFSYMHEEDYKQKLLIAIFGAQQSQVIPTRYNPKAVFQRLKEQLKEYDQVLPGTYHPDAKLRGRMYAVNFAHFRDCRKLVLSYLELIDRAKELFFKAWEEDLSAEEICEYNFLVSVIGLQDILLHKRCRLQDTIEGIAAQKDYLHYDLLKSLIPVYKKEGLIDFFTIVKIHENHLFEPWKCTEFCNDRKLVQRYVDIFPEAKSEMRKFSMAVSNILCEYSWSDEPQDEDCEKVHKAYVPKTEEELDGDEAAIELIKALTGPVKLGGVTVSPRFSLVNEDEYETHRRVMARIMAAYASGGVSHG